jgi:hypothetical protein
MRREALMGHYTPRRPTMHNQRPVQLRRAHPKKKRLLQRPARRIRKQGRIHRTAVSTIIITIIPVAMVDGAILLRPWL